MAGVWFLFFLRVLAPWLFIHLFDFRELVKQGLDDRNGPRPAVQANVLSDRVLQMISRPSFTRRRPVDRM
jgi:hypothetical protein